MKIIEQQDAILIRINTPTNINFFKEHYSILKENNFVNIIRFGRAKLNIDNLKKLDTLILLDSGLNNNNSYIIKYTELEPYQIDKVYDNYPSYYEDIFRPKQLVFKAVDIVQVEFEMINNNFNVRTTMGTIDSVRKSICQNFYIKSKNNLEF